jgi:hypothetical protein
MPDFIYHKGPRPTIGPDRDEEPRAACADNFWPFDEMLEHTETSRHHATARMLAAQVCATCPLLATCEFAVMGRTAA